MPFYLDNDGDLFPQTPNGDGTSLSIESQLLFPQGHDDRLIISISDNDMNTPSEENGSSQENTIATATVMIPSSDSGTRNSGGAVRSDKRGCHWKDKVKQGCPPQPWKKSGDWANLRKEMESEMIASFPGLTLPWRDPRGAPNRTRNTMKVLFIVMIKHSFNRTVELEWTESGEPAFFGIRRILVRADRRASFDAGVFPSVDALSRRVQSPYKRFARIWETAGFVEHVGADGGLLLRYDHATFAKQRAQQAGKRGRLPPGGE